MAFVGSKIAGSNEERTPKPREKHFAPSGGGGIGSSRQMEEQRKNNKTPAVILQDDIHSYDILNGN